MAPSSIHFFAVLASKRYFSVIGAMNIKDKDDEHVTREASGTYQQQLATSHQLIAVLRRITHNKILSNKHTPQTTAQKDSGLTLRESLVQDFHLRRLWVLFGPGKAETDCAGFNPLAAPITP